MGQSLWVPYPEHEFRYRDMPVFWRYHSGVEEDGIKVYAMQFVAFYETEHYAWLAPAYWLTGAYGNPEPERWLAEWKSKRNRYAIKKVLKTAERSYAFSSKKLAMEGFLRRKKYHLMRLKQDIAVVTTLVDGLKNVDESSLSDDYNFGHNAETESWVFL
ncbi:hypothetical protein [Rosenbergiella metrosideri]|uniref:hypothetical protein n=1 Tax=Rosenbergiella metrosideri TaxID=2921185 RepID=UPI001F4F5CB6|nr:hypothetical protein [Rosenbergiella metrosideri]